MVEVKSPLRLEERPTPTPGPNEVVVQLRAAALNRRDFWITQGMYPGIELPVILGSDGAGTVTATGNAVGNYWIDRAAIINPGFNWGNQARAQSDDFNILGMPRDGTFATHVCVPAAQLRAKPEHLSWEEACAMPLAGVTAWRAVFTQGNLQRGENVLVTGIGGGVATFALQFAAAAGANVWVTSSSNSKIEDAVALGARGGFDYTDKQWSQQLAEAAGPIHLIIDSAAGAGYADLIELAAPGGRIVNYGATTGPPENLDMFKLFWKQLRLQGTTMGSPDDFDQMLQFAERHRIHPVIDSVRPLAEGNDAIQEMKSSSQFGKLVLTVS